MNANHMRTMKAELFFGYVLLTSFHRSQFIKNYLVTASSVVLIRATTTYVDSIGECKCCSFELGTY